MKNKIYEKYNCKKHQIYIYFFNVKKGDRDNIINFIESINLFQIRIDAFVEKIYDFLLETKLNVILGSLTAYTYTLSFHGIDYDK